MIRSTLLCASLAALVLAACGDDGRPHDEADASGVDAAPAIDAAPPIDGAPEFVAPTPFAVPLSAAGPDQLQSAAAGPNNTFYAAGWAAATLAAPRLVTVVKLTLTGPDLTFGGGGGDGVATTTLDFKGGSGEVGLGVQPGGKLIVSATVANATNASDRDVAVVRLNTDGTLDTTFGDGGVRRLDLGTAHDNAGTLVGMDAARGVAIGDGGVIYVYAVQRGEGTATAGGPRLDTDYAVVKLSAEGAVETSFGGGDGKFTLDILESSATARGINLLPGGSILASGYANSTATGSVQPVLFKLTSAGALDPTFATGGLFHEIVLPIQTEVYNVAVHPNHLVTAGYGRATGTQNDWVSLRFALANGARDTTWGGAPNGAVLIDASGMMVGDNCRSAIALPGGKTLLLGSTGPSNMPAQDAAFAVLDATGRLDTAFGDGLHTYALGTNGSDQFWGGAASATHALIVGFKGGGATPTDTVNDDAFGVLLPLR